MNTGFFHPGRGYWEAIGPVSEGVRKTYPNGTIEVPLRPSALHVWGGGEWREDASLKAEAKARADERVSRALARRDALASVAATIGITEQQFKDAVRAALE